MDTAYTVYTYLQIVTAFVFEVAKPLIAVAVTAGVARIVQRLNLGFITVSRAFVEQQVANILIGVEEEAQAKVKVLGPGAIKAAEKFEQALTRVLDAVPGVTADEARALIKSTLPKIGLGAAAFLAEVKAAATNETR